MMYLNILFKTIFSESNLVKQRSNIFKSNVKHLTSQRKYSSEVNILKSPFSDVVLPNLPLHKYIFENINKWPNATAIECGISGKKYSYSQLETNSLRFATSLKKLGLKRGDVLAIILPNIPEYPIACIGPWECGIIVTTVNPSYTKDEIADQLIDSDSKCILCHPLILPVVLEAKKQLKKNINIICTNNIDGSSPKNDSVILFEELINDSVETLKTFENIEDLNETLVIPYSSGTTGKPKGTCLTHACISANLAQYSHPQIVKHIETHGNHQDVLPAILPFFHCYGLVVIMIYSLRYGSRIVSLPKFDPKYFLNILENYENQLLLLVPPLIFFLGNSDAVKANHLINIREITSGAAPCGAHDFEKIRRKARKTIMLNQAYGLTETSPIVACHKVTGSESDNTMTVGKTMPNALCKILDIETGKPLPSNQPGEICIKGPQLMKGYLNNAKATAETIDSEGWLHTGDIAYYDENEFIYITDRIKELIKVKGFQVAPAELEDVIRRYPGVLEVGVVGAPCHKTGETPVAFVHTEPGAKISDKEIKDFVASKLSKNKHITSVTFLDAIPKTMSGKILRKELRKLIK